MHVPQSNVGSDSLRFASFNRSPLMDALGLHEPQPNQSQERLTGVEQHIRQDGQHEFIVHPGNDARANAAMVQDAVNRAAKENGGIVSLGEGIYKGSVNVTGDNISINAEKGKAVFDMTGVTQSNQDSVFRLQGKNLTVDGVTIQNWKQNANGEPVVGIDVRGGSDHITLNNLNIHDLGQEPNAKGDAHGGAHAIRVQADNGRDINDVIVANSDIHDMKLGQHEAISFMAENGNINKANVFNNRLYNNDNVGVVFEGSNKGQVSNFGVYHNLIADSQSSANPTYREASAAAVQVDSNVSGGRILGNAIEHSDYGVVLESEKGGTDRNIDIMGNRFDQNKGAHVYFDASHQPGTAVDGVRVQGNQYSSDAPLIGTDRNSGIGRISGGDNHALQQTPPRPVQREQPPEQQQRPVHQQQAFEQPQQPPQQQQPPLEQQQRPPQQTQPPFEQRQQPFEQTQQPLDKPATSAGRHDIRLNDAIVSVPNDLDPNKPIHFETYFHGFYSNYQQGFDRAKMDQHLQNAPPNTVLVAPRWQDHEAAASTSDRQYTQNGGLNTVLNHVFQSVPELQRNQLGARDTLGLVGYSAGYKPVGQALDDKHLASKVTDIVMLDSPSTRVQQFVRDHFADFVNGQKRFAAVGGDWKGNEYRQFQQEIARRLQSVQRDPNQYIRSGNADEFRGPTTTPFTFLYTGRKQGTGHMDLPAHDYGRVAF